MKWIKEEDCDTGYFHESLQVQPIDDDLKEVVTIFSGLFSKPGCI